MVVSRGLAMVSGVTAIVVVAAQAFLTFRCYGRDVSDLMLVVPLLPAMLSLATANPFRAVGACALFVPWLLLAYNTDCVDPYSGGGAAMIYIAVIFWGVPSVIVGALVTGPIMRMLGISVAGR